MALTITVQEGQMHLSGNPILVTVSGGVAPAGSSEYKLLCKVKSVYGVSLVGQPFIDAKAPVAGSAVFDVSGYVHQPAPRDFHWPQSGQVTGYIDYTYDVRFQCGERYIDSNGDLQESWGAETETNFILAGGVGFRTLGYWQENDLNFHDVYVAKMKFLTHMPTNQVVHPYQPVKVWGIPHSSQQAFLSVKGYYEDSTSYERIVEFGLYMDMIFEFSVSPYLADPVNLAPVKGGVKMSYYDVTITTVSDGIEATMRFYVDHTYHEDCNYLFFLNSLGGIDCVWLSGSVEKSYNTQSVQASKPWNAAATLKTRTTVISSRSGKRSWKINSGWKSRLEIEALSDAMLSKEAWLLEDAPTFNSGTLIPVNVVNSQTVFYNTESDMYSLELDLEEAHENNYN